MNVSRELLPVMLLRRTVAGRMASTCSALLLAVWWAVAGVGCGAHRPPPSVPLATSLDEILPHADRDHFVYVFTREDSGQLLGDGVQVEHITALDAPGTFEVALSENGVGTGRVRVRDVGSAILLLGEDDLTRGVRLSYEPPLPYIEVPLIAGERHATSTATAARLSDGTTIGTLRVTEIVAVRAGPVLHALVGDFQHTVLLDMQRTLEWPEGVASLTTHIVLVPGIGEVRSEGTAEGAPTIRRALACATIGGRHVGDCHDLKARLEEFKRARPPDV